MSLPNDASLGALSDREILLMVYAKVDAIAEASNDHEDRLRVLEAQSNRTLGLMAATGGGSGAVAGGVVAVIMKLLGGFG